MEIEGGVGRNQHFVVNLARLLVRALQQVRRDLNPIAILLLVDFHVVRLESGRHHHLIAAPRLYRNRPVLRIHGNIRVGTDRVTIFLPGLREGRRRQTGCQNQSYDRGLLKTRHKNAPAAGNAGPPFQLLNTIQRDLVKKCFLLIRIHQMLPSVCIPRIPIHVCLRFPYIGIHRLQLIFICGPHRRGTGGNCTQKLLIFRARLGFYLWVLPQVSLRRFAWRTVCASC